MGGVEKGQDPQRVGALGLLAVGWGLGGTAALLLRATWSLSSVSLEAVSAHVLVPWQWGLAAGWTAAMCYFQGYRGFQRGFSRRAVARALHLARHPRPFDVLLAPLFCIGLVRATPRRLRANWLLLGVMVALIFVLRLVPQPYRGLVDAGVVAGLAWGVAAMAVILGRALRGCPPASELELPDAAPGGQAVEPVEAA